jgi:hypothetical protein
VKRPAAAVTFTLLAAAAPVLAQPEELAVDSVRLVVDVRADHTFQEVADFRLRHAGAAGRTLALSSPRPGATFSSAGRALAAGRIALEDRAATDLRRTAAGAAEAKRSARLRTLRVDPAVLVDGQPVPSRVESLALEVRLPPGARRIVYSSLAPTSRTVAGGRVVYRWQYANLYPVEVFVLYQTTAHELEATKRVRSRQGSVVEIEVAVTNLGPRRVKGVRITEDFPTSIGEPVPGQAGFSDVGRAGSDPRLLLARTLPAIRRGATRTVTYRLDLAAGPAALRPTRVYVGDDLVAMSNRLKL